MGLLAALLWGGTDFLVGLNARAVGVKRAVYFGQALGFLIMTLLLVIFPAFLFKALDATLSVWLLGVAAALLTVSGALALSKAFALGKAAIVAPLVTSYGVVTTLLSSGCQGLLITLDYDQAQKAGPPFAVSNEEVQVLLGPYWMLERLEERDILGESGKFLQDGVTRLEERAYRLTRR